MVLSIATLDMRWNS